MSGVPLPGRPRYSQRPLPPYSYVPGQTPHPVSDPRGHMHGATHEPAPPLDSDNWQDSDAYLYGIDLFNHGYYWEAHEAWESLWLAAGRRGPTAMWLKALIKLAAAMVKVRAGNPVGALRHAFRVQDIVCDLFIPIDDDGYRMCGIRMTDVIQLALNVMRMTDIPPTKFRPDAELDQWLELA